MDEKAVAVSGALGFVASRLVPRLVSCRRVVAVVRPGRQAERLAALGVDVRRADLEDGLAPAILEGVGAFVHLAGMALAPRLVPALEAAGVSRAVFVSSAGVHTRLESRSAALKRAGEEAVRGSGLDYAILRPSMIYGLPGDRNLARLLRWLERTPLVPVPGRAEALQQPVHVDDLVGAIEGALAAAGPLRREYDLGGPEALPLRALAAVCGRALGRRVWVVPVPLGAAHAAVRASRSLGLPCPVRPEQVLRLAESKAVDIGPARRDLGFAPRSFEEGIAAEAEMIRRERP